MQITVGGDYWSTGDILEEGRKDDKSQKYLAYITKKVFIKHDSDIVHMSSQRQWLFAQDLHCIKSLKTLGGREERPHKN